MVVIIINMMVLLAIKMTMIMTVVMVLSAIHMTKSNNKNGNDNYSNTIVTKIGKDLMITMITHTTTVPK